MKRFLIVIFFLVAANVFIAKSVHSGSFLGFGADSLSLAPDKMHSNEEQLLTTIIQRYHYKKVKLNDSLSSDIFNRYLKTLDYSRSYFYASDIKDFEKYRYNIDDYLQEGKLDYVYNIFNVFKKRVNERIDFSESLLKNNMDFASDDSLQVKREDAPWFTSEKEMNAYWTDKVKNDALNLKLTGKDDSSITSSLKKRYEVLRKNINQYNSEDVFQFAMNAYTEAIDPHTNYMSPITSDNFKIDMARSLEGIGAQLGVEDDYTKVVEIIPGGPAFKSKQLFQDDRIIAVAQADTGEFVDVIGWRINDVVQLIRGPKGTVVRLSVLSTKEGNNAHPKEIRLVRDKITLEEQSAKSDVIEIKNGKTPFKIGVITVPAFYADFEAQQKGDPNYKSTTRDVKRILDTLRMKKVDGVVIDLRYNGGGSLNEAISLTGLFIKDGPVVQVKDANGSVDVGTDPDPGIVYDGPLAVLVNRFSASASEIFTGAIQDYGRGVIIGENTYGKGTVQNMIDLNRLMKSGDDKLGQVKLTIAKYYRINGGSTQNLGVVPDVEFPSAIDEDEFGERSEPSALPWDQIQSSSFQKYGDVQKYLPDLKKRYEERTGNNPEFDYLKEDIQEYKTEKNKGYVSLNEKVRKQEKDENEEKKFQRENERRKENGLKLLKKGETPAEKEDVKNDPMLKESANILSDYILLSIG